MVLLLIYILSNHPIFSVVHLEGTKVRVQHRLESEEYGDDLDRPRNGGKFAT